MTTEAVPTELPMVGPTLDADAIAGQELEVRAIARVLIDGHLDGPLVQGNLGPRLHEALLLVQHLFRPDRTPEAIYAHRILVSEIIQSLQRAGREDATLLLIVEHLHAYIEHGGYEWRDGQWRADA